MPLNVFPVQFAHYDKRHHFVDDESILITKEGLKKLKEELEGLKTNKRSEIAARLKEAISYGDLSENAEYEEAKNDQAFIEGRILELENQIKNAKIITEGASMKTSKGKMIDIIPLSQCVI